eukprot:gene8245-12727_t
MARPTAAAQRSVLSIALVTVLNFASYSTWTLLNKWQFTLYSLKFSVLLTSYQMLFVGLVSYFVLLLQNQVKVPSRATLKRIIPLGMVRAADIGFGNAALRLLSVALQQIIKSTIPVYVCVLSAVVLHKVPSPKVWATLIPVVGGVVLASWGELSASWLGIFMAVVSCFARAGKAIINDLLLHASSDEERLSAVQIMSFESPLSGCILFFVSLVCETPTIIAWLEQEDRASVSTIVLFNSVCGVLMFLNQWSYISIIKQTSSVTCQVLMNLKMVTLIVISVGMFSTVLEPIHIVGIVVAAGGCTLYALVCSMEDSAAKLALKASPENHPDATGQALCAAYNSQLVARRMEI